jgi:hypothetical protein
MKRSIIILVLLAVAGVLAVNAATGGGGTPTGKPFDQATFGVDGPDGQPVVCSNGKELRVAKDKLARKPPKPGTKDAQAAAEEKGTLRVWRCGTGKDPDKNPRLIDKADDPLVNEAG